MNILVINAGSSSLKYQLIDMKDESVSAKGVCERIGQAKSSLIHKARGKETVIERDMPTHTAAIKLVLDALTHKDYGVIKSMAEVGAVGHRVLHSAEDFNSSVLITPEVMKIIESNVDLGPLHMPANILGIKACAEAMPGAPMAAVFDTTFHSTMPDYAYMYALPYEAYSKYRVRKYGFHGTSHMYVSGEAAAYLKSKGAPFSKIITCHLGNGASVSAVKDGKCADTSMGLTPLEGLIMGTRSGDLDPAVLEFLMQKTGMSIAQTTDYLNKKSGVLGICGVSDFRDLNKKADGGDKLARLALDMFCYRVKKYIGAYAAALGGADAIVFTAGIGENTPNVREKIVAGLEFLGVSFDAKRNANAPRGAVAEITKTASKVKVLVIPTDEELVIARETLRLI